MISHTFRQFAFIIVIMCTSAVDGVANDDDFQSIFLRIYLGYLDEYVDYSLENASMITSRINNNMSTVMYIHGYTEHLERESVQTIVRAYLTRNDHNVIGVDYSKVANQSYINMVTNVARVADVLSTALNQMKDVGFDTEKLHIVSHSIGSQVAGYIGRKVNFSVPRITGLDPAGPFFNLIMPTLSSNDARFVDIIHTDYGIFGVGLVTGTVDFFPNGGERVQPGCPQSTTFNSDEDYCSHHRSWEMYAESVINEFAFLGVECSSFSNFMSGKCNDNTPIVMGYATPSTARNKIYLVTSDQSPFGLRNQGYIMKN